MLDLVTPREIASLIGKPYRTVSDWVKMDPCKMPPVAGKAGNYTVYLRSDVDAWLKARQQKETA